MGIRDWFRRDRSADDPVEEHEYKGYRIRPTPHPSGGQYHTAGVIVKTFADGDREQSFLRADTHASHEAACQHAVFKGRQIIDERGDALFEDR